MYLVLIPLAAVSATRRAPTHEDIWLMKRVGAPQVSPDGRWLVTSVIEPAYDDNAQLSDLWLIDTTARHSSRRLTSTRRPENGVTWSPDSRRIAFSAQRDNDDVPQIYTLDLAATFHDYSGTVPLRALQSHSLRPLLEGADAARDVAYSEWHVHASRCGVALKLRTVRTKTHKCTFELESGAGELYDLKNDPEEMTNRFEDPAYASVRRELHDMMRERPGEVLQTLAEPVGMA